MGEPPPTISDLAATATPIDSGRTLRHCLEQDASVLLISIRAFIRRSGFVGSEEEVAGTALEVLSETVVEALNHAERFDPSRSPKAWLLGIALNLIKRKRSKGWKPSLRETPISQMELDHVLTELAPGDLFDQLASLNPRVFDALAGQDPEPDLARRQPILAALAMLSLEDVEIIELSVLHGMDSNEVARVKQITPVAARMRKHRALERLRAVYQNLEVGGR